MTDAPLTLADLANALSELHLLDDVSFVQAARRMAVSLPQQLARLADERTFELTRTDTQPNVAARLGVTKSAVERAVTRHRQTMPAPANR